VVCLPPHGRLGAILVGINFETLEVKNVESADYCVKLHLRSKNDGFKWVFILVYGAAQDTSN
jgi:hypothetical protein